MCSIVSGDSETKQNLETNRLPVTCRKPSEHISTVVQLPPALLSVQGSVGSPTKENRPTLHEILPLLGTQTGYELIYGTGYELSIRIPDFWYWPAHTH